jgi:hypothetical protein
MSRALGLQIVPAVARDLNTPANGPARSTVDREPVRRRVEGIVAIPASAEPDRVVERRVALRRPAAVVPSITGLRLSPLGGKTVLVNISTSGALVRYDARLLLGTVVTVTFEGTFSPSSTKAWVARCAVAAIESGVVWYDIGISFNDPISLDDGLAAPNPQSEPALPPRQALAIPTGPFNRW